MKAIHAVSLQIQKPGGDDGAVEVDSLDPIGAVVVVRGDEPGLGGEVEVLRDQLAGDAELAVGEAFQGGHAAGAGGGGRVGGQGGW